MLFPRENIIIDAPHFAQDVLADERNVLPPHFAERIGS